MQTAGDGTIRASDLRAAFMEVKAGGGEAIMARLSRTDPALATYIESIAAHLTHPKTQASTRTGVMIEAMERILVIVRAYEIGHYRLWKDLIPPSSPLGKLLDSEPKQGPTDSTKK
jgi:hypothetical protein